MKKKYRHRLPKGWTLDEVQAIAKHYDDQSEADGAAEIEAADNVSETLMVVPSNLVPRVQKLIKQHKSKTKSRRPKSRHAA